MEGKLSNYIGSPVVTPEGKVFGYIKDFVADDASITGVIVQKRGVFTRDCILPFDAVKAFLRDKVVTDCQKIRPITWRDGKNFRYLYNAEIGVIGENGEIVGSVSDMNFQTDDGQIVSLELCKGLRDDIIHGRSVLNNFSLEVNGQGEYEAICKGGDNE